jgi:uncharacterized protein YuzE
MGIGPGSYKYAVGGGELSHDGVAGASYLCVNHTESVCSNAVARTIEIGGGILIDVDRDGYVFGVENYAGEITMADLVQVLAWCRIGEGKSDPT